MKPRTCSASANRRAVEPVSSSLISRTYRAQPRVRRPGRDPCWGAPRTDPSGQPSGCPEGHLCQPCGASEILLSGLPNVWQYVCADSRVALISSELGSAPFLSFSILLTSSLCFFSSCVEKSLHLVSP